MRLQGTCLRSNGATVAFTHLTVTADRSTVFCGHFLCTYQPFLYSNSFTGSLTARHITMTVHSNGTSGIYLLLLAVQALFMRLQQVSLGKQSPGVTVYGHRVPDNILPVLCSNRIGMVTRLKCFRCNPSTDVTVHLIRLPVQLPDSGCIRIPCTITDTTENPGFIRYTRTGRVCDT